MVQTKLEQLHMRGIEQSLIAFDQIAIHSADEYTQTIQLMNALLDVVGDNEEHPMADLLNLVSNVISDYDKSSHNIPPSRPVEVLRYLMEAHNLTQSELKDIVAQSNLSAILSGKRKINTLLARKLAHKFKVSADLFVGVKGV